MQGHHPSYSQLSETGMAVEEWTTKRKRPFGLLPHTSVIFTVNKEDSSWHFNLSVHNLSQPIENSRFIWRWHTHCKTLKTALRTGKHFMWGLCPRFHDFSCLGRRQAEPDRSIFRQGCFRAVKIGRVNSTLVKARVLQLQGQVNTASRAHRSYIFLQTYHQIWSSFSEA